MVPSYLKPATLDNGDVWSTPSQRLGTSSSELWNALSGRLRERKKAEWAAKWKSRAINKILQSALKIKPKKGEERRWNSRKKEEDSKPKNQKCGSTWSQEFFELWPQNYSIVLRQFARYKPQFLEKREGWIRIRLRSPKGRFWRKMKLSQCWTISMSDEINKSHR